MSTDQLNAEKSQSNNHGCANSQLLIFRLCEISTCISFCIAYNQSVLTIGTAEELTSFLRIIPIFHTCLDLGFTFYFLQYFTRLLDEKRRCFFESRRGRDGRCTLPFESLTTASSVQENTALPMCQAQSGTRMAESQVP